MRALVDERRDIGPAFRRGWDCGHPPTPASAPVPLVQLLIWSPSASHGEHVVGSVVFPGEWPRGRWHDQWSASSCTYPGFAWRVSRDANGAWACSCPAWVHGFPRRRCAHIRDVADREMPAVTPSAPGSSD